MVTQSRAAGERRRGPRADGDGDRPQRRSAPDARLELRIAAIAKDAAFGDKLGKLLADHYDQFVKPALETASTSDGSDAEQAIVLALHWARRAAVFGADTGPREDEM